MKRRLIGAIGGMNLREGASFLNTIKSLVEVHTTAHNIRVRNEYPMPREGSASLIFHRVALGCAHIVLV